MSILRCIAIAASGGYALLCSISGPTLAQGARSGQPSLTATEAFGQYAAIQDKIRPSFVLKTRVTYEDRGSFFQGTKTHEAILDVSYRDCGAEGNRVKLREEGWGELGHLTVAQETPEYRSWLWDGRNYMRYTGPPKRQAGLPGARSGSVFAYMSGTGEITDRRLTSRLWGSPLMGYFPSADEPFDNVLRQMPEASWAYRLEQVGGITCHMIEAATRHGRYKVWLDPEHGYNVARAELSLQAGRRQFICDQPFDKYGKERSWSVENVRFQRREGFWFPSEADTYDYLLLDDAGRFVATRTHIEVTDLTVNPDHAALHSFTSDDIPDGPGVLGYVDLNEGLYTAWDPHYHWQNGAEFVVDRASHRIKYQNGTELLPVVKVIPPLRELEIKIDPAQVRGRQILLCFCDLTQPSSQQTVLQLSGRAGLLQRDDLFVGLLQCSKDDPDSIEKWLRDNRIPFRIGALWQITDKVLRAWGVQKLPWLVLSDANHVVIDEGLDPDDLGRRFEAGRKVGARDVTIPQLLDRMGETFDRAAAISSYSIKWEVHSDGVSSLMGPGRKRTRSYEEHVTDGTRMYKRRDRWGECARGSNLVLAKEDPEWICWLWNGKTYLTYGKCATRFVELLAGERYNDPEERAQFVAQHVGDVTIYRRNMMGDSGTCGFDVYMWTKLYGDLERIDRILRRADRISLRDNMERVGSSQCYVIDAEVAGTGRYSLWIDPNHGYQIATAFGAKSPSDTTYKAKGATLSYSISNVQFSRIGELWVPMEWDVKYEDKWASGDCTSSVSHWKRTEVVLNPTFKESAFEPSIPNGWSVRFEGTKEKYTWRDGKVVDASGRALSGTLEKEEEEGNGKGANAVPGESRRPSPELIRRPFHERPTLVEWNHRGQDRRFGRLPVAERQAGSG